jgi:hypothetical protein
MAAPENCSSSKGDTTGIAEPVKAAVAQQQYLQRWQQRWQHRQKAEACAQGAVPAIRQHQQSDIGATRATAKAVAAVAAAAAVAVATNAAAAVAAPVPAAAAAVAPAPAPGNWQQKRQV